MPLEFAVNDKNTLRIDDKANSPEFCTRSEFS